ncbi:glutamate synthase-related protein [Schwartzia succinivorans]|jgi:glutamate synthase (NADPH/NADH) large chain|uniref:glutamate synthase (NADPH) n=1 Tax=Schwartzia succinivorans DSM 10502 TaxID=1123243 RepID=A0A1M5A9D0_9FIRM|nr:glutamate synthase-related protein [Schwartzia succinivorans]MBQ1470727.1 4Fe-4S dicluster domain-containing protein [Schwartzia sp. (in: firmicutes)]MBQ5414464.1 4Fe-4S dicluster domain-containing protein [Schwartzia sp. (in: firmicutes)]SHF26879.1 glutamate synthase (NADPH/NADH) large chain [Schwartzia succinivorans DSM 10502]
METIKVQDVAVNDLPWRIEYHAERCTRCGSCVASCSFNAIEVVVQRQSMTVSEQNQPSPVRRQLALAIIKQKKDLAYMCRGCGMCERVCPNNAIRPVRNPDDRKALLSRDNGPIKRGGRTNLNAQRTLDSIIVGRISQMTDPALDSVRHTFDIRAPFGRVLSPRELPLTVSGDKLEMAHRTPPVRWIYPLIFSDMSIGALSTRAWEAVALATAYLNEKCNLPVRMSSGEGGMPVKLLESEYLKYFIIQIASGHFGWNRIIKAMPHMVTDPGGILIKIGQGAKPGDGGLLPEAKVAEHVQAIRGVPKATLSSPPNHQGLYSIEESVQKMHLSLNAAFGFRVPVAVKCAASATSVAVYHNLLRDPYKICGGFFIDGIQGGTGAAAEVSLDHTGHPVVSKIRDCYLSAVRQGLQGQIPLYGGGGIGLTGNAAADAFKMICLGANGVFCGKVLIQLLGCIGNEKGRCNACNTGKCPTGICTQDPRLVKRLDVDRGAQKIVDYVLAFDKELRKLMAPIGNSSLPVGRSDALVSTDKAVADKLGIQYVC